MALRSSAVCASTRGETGGFSGNVRRVSVHRPQPPYPQVRDERRAWSSEDARSAETYARVSPFLRGGLSRIPDLHCLRLLRGDKSSRGRGGRSYSCSPQSRGRVADRPSPHWRNPYRLALQARPCRPRRGRCGRRCWYRCDADSAEESGNFCSARWQRPPVLLPANNRNIFDSSRSTHFLRRRRFLFRCRIF